MKEGVALGCTGAVAAVAVTAGLYPSIVDDLHTLRITHRRTQALQDAMSSMVIDKFEHLATSSPGKEFVVFEEQVYTYGLVDQMACRVASVALGWGLQPGQTVALMMENKPEFVWTFLGLC